MAKHIMEDCRYWILVVSMSPIAILLLIFMALGSLLQFLLKASLLFIIVAINTPLAMMINVSIMVFDYHFRKHSARLWKSGVCLPKSSNYPHWNWSDPRASVGLEIQIFVSDFLKTVTTEILVVVSAGIITFFTAPLHVFYISMAISLVGILHKWLNTNCLSKTALSCLCDGYGLNPMMFLYSFIGLFDSGCHPVAKCSFAARRAFLFVKDGSNVQFLKEDRKKVAARIIIAGDKGKLTSEDIIGPGEITGHSIPIIAPDEEYDQNRDKPRFLPKPKPSFHGEYAHFHQKETGTNTPHGTRTGTKWSAANGPPGSSSNLRCGRYEDYGQNQGKPRFGLEMKPSFHGEHAHFHQKETGTSTPHGTRTGTKWSAANGPPGSSSNLQCGRYEDYGQNQGKPRFGLEMKPSFHGEYAHFHQKETGTNTPHGTRIGTEWSTGNGPPGSSSNLRCGRYEDYGQNQGKPRFGLEMKPSFHGEHAHFHQKETGTNTPHGTRTGTEWSAANGPPVSSSNLRCGRYEDYGPNRGKPRFGPEMKPSFHGKYAHFHQKETGTSTPHGTRIGTEWSAGNGPPGSSSNLRCGCYEDYGPNRGKPRFGPEMKPSFHGEHAHFHHIDIETGTSTPRGTRTGTEWSTANGPPVSSSNLRCGRYEDYGQNRGKPRFGPEMKPSFLGEHAHFHHIDIETGTSTPYGTGTGTEWSVANGPPVSSSNLRCGRYEDYGPNQSKPNVKPKMTLHKATKNPSVFQKAGHYQFNEAASPMTTDSEANGAASPVTEVTLPIDFDLWNAFERGLFRLNPRIDFIKRDNGKYILKTFMVLKLCKALQCKGFLCEYPVERLELPEDYSKANELYHFLVTLSTNDGFVTDKMRGRYEHSLTLSEIVEEVEKNVGYKIVDPMDKKFVVA